MDAKQNAWDERQLSRFTIPCSVINRLMIFGDWLKPDLVDSL